MSVKDSTGKLLRNGDRVVVFWDDVYTTDIVICKKKSGLFKTNFILKDMHTSLDLQKGENRLITVLDR